jgi:transposase
VSDLLILQQVLGIPELHLTGCDVKERTIELRAEMLLSRGICPVCGKVCERLHQYLGITLRHLPILGRACFVDVKTRQLECECGKTFSPPLDFVLPEEHHVTWAYAEDLFRRVKGSSIQVVAEAEGIPEKTLEAIYYTVARHRDARASLEPTSFLGIDEVALHKGHGNFKAVIYDLKHGKILKLLESREKATLVAWFRAQPQPWLSGIRIVAIDMWEPYRQAVREVFGDQVDLVADKFHVVKLLGERLTDCRRQIQRAAPEAVKEKLKGIRWAILKQPKKQTPAEKRALKEALRHSPELREMYQIKQAFVRLYRWTGRGGGIRRLRQWIKRVRSTKHIHLHKFADTVERWWDEVTAYFRLGATNAGAEGLNTVIKLVNRRGFGFRNHEHFELRIKHETGGLAA